jgi:hypothetical protein
MTQSKSEIPWPAANVYDCSASVVITQNGIGCSKSMFYIGITIARLVKTIPF